MAANFSIRFKRRNGGLHIRLAGDFDGTSAHMLLSALGRHIGNAGNIVVDTTGLRDVFLFGCGVLQANLSSLKAPSGKVLFVGTHRAAFVPESACEEHSPKEDKNARSWLPRILQNDRRCPREKVRLPRHQCPLPDDSQRRFERAVGQQE